MQIGDLVLFRGSWVHSNSLGNPKTGVVVKRWFNGRTKKLQIAEILWDNGEVRKVMIHLLGVINESR